MSKHPKDGASPEPEGVPTELDVKLPSKIALAHAEETLEQRTTLPRVALPSREQILTTPRRPSHAPGVPSFNPQSFPPPAPSPSPTGPHPLPRPASAITGPHQLPRPRASTTGPHPLPSPGAPVPEFDPQSYPPLDAEFFRPTETVRTPKLRLGVPWIALMLLGVVLGTAVTILLLRFLR